ncbi:cytochrome P450 [Tsukamurella sp. PLM1]|uniref:cytochrome P450 n=1 Tax=Tsukamurella sp. PLM1 TaxID=2929795 RepID=UPI00204CE63C|nr:cytochrome P450 [Tsukamurella sp. PLM1]BDH56034.1 cytochrome P450 [Tsukamurella sp. PLM1]
MRLDLGPERAYVLTTPELIREVGFRTAGEFHRRDVQESMHEAVRAATNVLSGEAHELRRRMIAPALRSGRIAEYAGTAATIADDWAQSLPFDRRVDLRTQAHGLILRTVTSTLFTADLGAAAADRIRQDMPWLLSQVIVRGALPASVQRLRVRANRRFATSAAALRTEIGAVVAAYRASDRDRHDVLSALVAHVDPETGVRLSDDEIIDELILMVAAGVGSTASILAWVWHEIMSDGAVAARVRAEVDDVVGAGPVAPEHLPRLEYLRRVVQETLRMWGPWISSQNADGEVVFGTGDAAGPDGTTLALPADAMIVYSPYLVHHDPRYYPEPERFDPDRWTAERAHEIDKRAVLPFGVGERHCPGSNFAITIILLATAALYSSRDPRPVGGDPRPSTTDFVPAPSALPVVLGPRAYA